MVIAGYVLTGVSSLAVEENPKPPESQAGVSATVEQPAAVPSPPQPSGVSSAPEVAAPPNDSIHAVEINIDPVGGALIVDRNGQRYYLPSDELGGNRIPDYEGEYTTISRTDLVRFGTDIHIPSDEKIDGEVVCIFGDVYVDGAVTHSVVAIFGHVYVDGQIGMDVIAPMGVVHVGPNARVQRQVVASRIDKAPGGQIGDRPMVLINLFGLPMDRLFTRATLTAILMLKLLFGLFLVMLAHVFAAKNIRKVRTKLQASFVKSLILGIGAQILFIPLVLLLLVTIVGIPVAVFIVPMMVIAAVVLSMAAAGLWVGDLIGQNSGLRVQSQLGRTMMGQVIIWLPALLAAFFWASESWSGNGVFQISAITFAMLAAVVGYSVITVGTGAVLLTRYGTRPKDTESDVMASRKPQAAKESTSTPLPERPHGQHDSSGAEPAVS